MKVKEESEKVDVILSIHKTRSMASDPTTSWQIDGETMETAIGFFFFPWVPKSLQMATETMKLRQLLLGRKAMANIDSI